MGIRKRIDGIPGVILRWAGSQCAKHGRIERAQIFVDVETLNQPWEYSDRPVGNNKYPAIKLLTLGLFLVIYIFIWSLQSY